MALLRSHRQSVNSVRAYTAVSTAERFAATLQRRALPMPPPVDVDAAARSIADIAANLDIGVGLGVIFSQQPVEEAIWRTAVELGLSLDSAGEFVWGDPPQLSVLPLNDPTQFTLGGVRSCRTHEGLSIGFSAPQVIAPLESLRAALKVADEFAGRFRGLVIDDDGNQMTPALRSQYESNIQLAIRAFDSAGLEPGSSEAMRLFGA